MKLVPFLLLLGLLSTAQAQVVHLRFADDFLAPVKHVYAFDLHQTKSSMGNDFGIILLDAFENNDTIIFQHPSIRPKIITKQAVLDSGNIVRFVRKEVYIKEFIMSASRVEESVRNVAQKVRIIKPEDLLLSSSSNVPDMLQQSGGLVVQKSQGGGGSPIIRGFEANKVLLVVDGIRMNNAIYRGGHLQNALTIDPFALDRLEVLFGPSSVMYGSDALGGVIHFYTKTPQFSITDSAKYEANVNTKFQTVNNSFVTHADASIGSKKVATLISLTHQNYGNTMMGTNPLTTGHDWGKTNYIAARIDDEDVLVRNPNPYLQIGTSFAQSDLMHKLRIRPGNHFEIMTNVQFSQSSIIPRYDRLNDQADDELKYAEWAYGPQNRFLSALHLNFSRSNAFFDVAKIIGSYQLIEESRIVRKRHDNNRRIQTENVGALGVNIDLDKRLSNRTKLLYGFESIHNDVQSTAEYMNLLTGEQTPAQTRYPSGGSTTMTNSLYLMAKHDPAKRWSFQGGIRGYHYSLKSNFKSDFLVLPFEEISLTKTNITGSVAMIYNSKKGWKYATTFASGFRAPNVDDLGKVFTKDDFVVIPNDQVNPENLYSTDVEISRTLEKFSFNLSGYASVLQNVILRKDFTHEGADSLYIEGEMHKIKANVNAGRGFITGGSLRLQYKLNKRVSLQQNLVYTYGVELDTDLPLGHIPPLYGTSFVNYKHDQFGGSIYAAYNASKAVSQMDLSGVDNHLEGLNNAFPYWYTLNLKVFWNPTPTITLFAALENILDAQYKQFASGIAAPGRNIAISFSVKI